MRITRETAIQKLRKALAKLTPVGHSTCRAVADANVFCRGFRRDSKTELKMRYAAVIDIGGTRKDIEHRADDYHVRRQMEEGAAVACDVEQHSYETCRGWDEFSNAELGELCFEMLGERVVVAG